MADNHDTARRLFAGLSAGALPDDLFAPEATVWTTTSGEGPASAYIGGIPILATCFSVRPTYHVDTLTAEADRVAAEVHAEGTLIDGQAYAMRYVFMMRVRDGRIVALAEHMNPIVVQQQIMPLLTDAMTKAQR